jgi:flagellar basal body-associated protein FliL
MEKDIPYIAFEGQMARNERTMKRLIIVLIVTIVLMALTNAMWLYAWTMYDYADDEASQEVTLESTDGNANYIGNDGDITNGESDGKDKEKAENQDKK